MNPNEKKFIECKLSFDEDMAENSEWTDAILYAGEDEENADLSLDGKNKYARLRRSFTNRLGENRFYQEIVSRKLVKTTDEENSHSFR